MGMRRAGYWHGGVPEAGQDGPSLGTRADVRVRGASAPP
jgi:hypothetical protein